MKKIFFNLSILLLIFTFSCQNESVIQKDTSASLTNEGASKIPFENDKPDVQTQIILGKKLDNPYSVKNMQAAFNYYNSVVLTSEFFGRRVIATHRYIEIMPNSEQNLQELDILDNSDEPNALTLQDYPMDYEILQEGDYYFMPLNDQDLYHPIYTVIPVGYQFKGDIKYKILDELYEPTNEEYDVETVSLFFANWTEDLAADDIYLTTETLPAFLNTEVEEQASGRRNRKFKPSGTIRIENSDVASQDIEHFQPLMQAKISYGRSLWWRFTYTDDTGFFQGSKSYRGKVRIRAKWRGYSATIRKAWNEIYGIQVSDHLMTETRNNCNITKDIYYSYGEDAGHLWYKGTVHNGIRKYIDYCNTNGISQTISYTNVWAFAKGDNSGATPMLYKYRNLGAIASYAGIGESNLWNSLVVGIFSQAINLLPHHLKPDQIYKGLRRPIANGNTIGIHQLIFHESGHYSHACKAGSDFWASIFASELANSIATINNSEEEGGSDPYRDGVEPSIESGDRIALAEGWARLTEFKITTSYYGKARISVTFLPETGGGNNNIINSIENFDQWDRPTSPDNNFETQGWFLHGLMWDIIDNRNEIPFPGGQFSTRRNSNGGFINNIVDKVNFNSNENDLSPVFNLLNGNVQNSADLRGALINANPDQSQGINDLFNSYGL